MSFTGDDLTLNDKCYSAKDKSGNVVFLGKLKSRDKFYNQMLGESQYNNLFTFEHTPPRNTFTYGQDEYHNTMMFDEANCPEEDTTNVVSPVPTGGKKKTKRSKSKKVNKVKKNRRKSSRRRKSTRRH